MKFLFIIFLIYLFGKMLGSVIRSVSTQYLNKHTVDARETDSKPKININKNEIEDADFDEVDE